MLRQGPRLAQPSPAMIRFPAPPGPYPSQTTYDLAHHDNTSRTDSNAYSVQNAAVKARSPAVATVNGDVYSSPTHPTVAAAPRHPLYHGQAIPQQQEQYGAMGSWGGGDNGGNNNNNNSVLAETAPFMISSKATSSAFGGGSGGADHDYLVATPMDSSGAAPSFASFASDQQQPPVANDMYGFVSTASQSHGVYNYSGTPSRATTFYNGGGGGGGGGEGQQMQEALVARIGSAAYQHQHPPPNWDKQQQQRVARHRQPWPSQQTYEPHQGVYDDDSIMRGELAFSLN